MDDPLRLGALHTIGVDVAHHIMANLLLPRLGNLVVDVVLVGLELGDLLVGDRQTLMLLSPGQCNPEPAPGLELVVLRKDVLHLIAGITGLERADITVMCHNLCYLR